MLMYRNNRDSSQYRCWHHRHRDHHRCRHRCTYAHQVSIILPVLLHPHRRACHSVRPRA